MEERELSEASLIEYNKLEDLKTIENSKLQLNVNLEELNQRKTEITMKPQSLREKVNKEGSKAKVQKLLALLESLKEQCPKNERLRNQTSEKFI